jgi:alkyl sulfatase BDS1-like metallo-beta-lactamase superfamily hydrolase
MSKFLSDEYMTEATAALAADANFSAAISNVALGLQFVVTGGPDGDVSYHLDVADGTGMVSLGTLDAPDVTVTNDYETSVGILTGELNTQMAFMTGKLKVDGNMAKLMMHQNVINALSGALSTLDVEY